MTQLAAPSGTRRGIYTIKLVVVPNRHILATEAAKIVTDKINASRNPHIGFATGSTPIETYERLVDLHKMKQLNHGNVKGMTCWNLDEYVFDPSVVGSNPKLPNQTFEHFMAEHLLDPLEIPLDRRNIPNWQTADPDSECQRFEHALRSRRKQTDIQILGIGSTELIGGRHIGGHMGFNEPGTGFDSLTHVVELTQRTRVANSRSFMTARERNILGLKIDEDPFEKIMANKLTESQKDYFFGTVMPRVPRFAMTIGIGTILDTSNSLLLLAFGEGKAHAIYNTLYRPNIETPASALWHHRDSTIIVDEAAASLLRFRTQSIHHMEPKPFNI